MSKDRRRVEFQRFVLPRQRGRVRGIIKRDILRDEVCCAAAVEAAKQADMRREVGGGGRADNAAAVAVDRQITEQGEKLRQ